MQVLIEAIESLLPDLAVALGPGGHVLQGGGVDAASSPLGLLPAGDQTRPFEHTQVFRDRRHAHVERLGEFGHREFAQGETSQNGSAGGVCEGGEGGAQVIDGHL